MGYYDTAYGITISTNFVPVSAYNNTPGTTADSPDSGGTFGVFGLDSGAGPDTVRYFLANKQDQIRQNTGLTQVKLATDVLTNVSAIWFEIWRRNGADDSTYDRVHVSSNLLASLSASTVNTITSLTGFPVREGDAVVLGLTRTSDASNCKPFVADTGDLTAHSTADVYEYRSDTAPDASFDWLSQTEIEKTIIPVEFTGFRPIFTCVGDSLISGPYTAGGGRRHTSYITNQSAAATFSLDYPDEHFAYFLSQELGIDAFQNLGFSSQRTSHIEARFAGDVAITLPRFIILEGGINDLYGGVGQSAYIANLTSIFNTCRDNAIKCIYLGMYPADSATDVQAGNRRTWNAAAQTLTASYANVVYMDTDSVLGVTRGSTGELDDLNTAYAAGDALPHLNVAGQQALAVEVAKIVKQNNFHL